MIYDWRGNAEHGPMRFFDGNGNQVTRLRRIDTETGAALQLVMDSDDLFVIERGPDGRLRPKEREIAVTLPIRVERIISDELREYERVLERVE